MNIQKKIANIPKCQKLLLKNFSSQSGNSSVNTQHKYLSWPAVWLAGWMATNKSYFGTFLLEKNRFLIGTNKLQMSH
jgi:hypothetical protein